MSFYDGVISRLLMLKAKYFMKITNLIDATSQKYYIYLRRDLNLAVTRQHLANGKWELHVSGYDEKTCVLLILKFL
jgi:hypothetical protein